MPVRSDSKDENFAYLIMRIIAGAVALAYIAFIFFKQPCDIDKQYLSCRVSGTLWDWVGSILFLGGCLSLSGVLNWVYKPKTEVVWVIVGAMTVLGAIIVWNL
jgi:hypothetical protein